MCASKSLAVVLLSTVIAGVGAFSDALSADTGHLVAQSQLQGLKVYAQPNAEAWCRADLDLTIRLAPNSPLLQTSAESAVPRIGSALQTQCREAVAARLTVERTDQPLTVLKRYTALKVSGWVAQPWSATSPVGRLRAARVGWEARCTGRASLLDQAKLDPSKAPEWLRGAWDSARQWKANTSQWIGETAAALGSGQWPGEFRARVADFEAAGAGLCKLVRQQIDYAGTALSAGRLVDAGRYIDRTMDLLKRVQAANQAANDTYLGALDQATGQWQIVFDTSNLAFSVTLAAATAGGSVAPAGAGYFAAKWGLFNTLEFWVDSTQMPVTEAAKERAIALVVDVVAGKLMTGLVPDDFNRLVAQGQMQKADWLLANASSKLVQQLPSDVNLELLRTAAEQVLAETRDDAIRIAVKRAFLEYLTAESVSRAIQVAEELGPHFGTDYLAKRGTPESAGGESEVSSAQVQQISSTELPPVLRGEWNQNPAACGSNPRDESEYPLIIEPGRFFMGDFSGVITRVVETAPGSFAVTATGSAEGETLSATYRMTLGSGGKRLRVDDAHTYYRCTQKSATHEWGPGIVPDSSIELGQNPCAETDLRICLKGLGLSDEAISFSVAFNPEYPGESFAAEFIELGSVDLVRVSVRFAPWEESVLVNGSPDLIPTHMVYRDLSTSFPDNASRALLRRHPDAAAFAATGVSAHRLLPSGSQRFVVATTITAGCRVCPVLGAAIAYIDFDATGKQLHRQNIPALPRLGSRVRASFPAPNSERPRNARPFAFRG